MSDERDETIERVRAALRPLPPSDPRAIAKILATVRQREAQPVPLWRDLFDRLRAQSVSVVATGGLVTAALVVGFLARGQMNGRSPGAAAPMTTAVDVAREPVVAIPAAATSGDMSVPVQFVFESKGAHNVSVVGDFNDWKSTASPMQTVGGGAWTVTLPLTPGRHVYAFVVDGEQWVADPRAPKAGDSDFGKPGSVIVVTAP